MRYVTSKEIKAATGIKNAATLTRWHRQGLIPAPTTRKQADNKGMISCWPEWVLHRCVRIKQLVNDKNRLEEIKEILGTNWQKAEERYTRSFGYSLREADRNAAFWNLEEAVRSVFTSWISSFNKKLRDSNSTILEDDLIKRVIPMLQEGVNPVLVIVGSDVYLTADFNIGPYLADHRSIGDAIAVIPFSEEMVNYISFSESVPTRPSVRPSKSVTTQSNNRITESDFLVVDTWGFEIAATAIPKPKPKKKK